MTQHWKADLALVANTLIWGATFTTVKNALADSSPILFVAVRFSLAAAVLALLYHRRLNLRSLVPGIAVGSLLFAGYGFQTSGLRFTTPSKSAFITGMTIPMVPLLSSFVSRRKPRPAEIAGVLTATVGMALMTLDNLHLRINRGDLLTFFCAIAFAGHIVALSHFSNWTTSQDLGFEALSLWQILTAAVFGIVSFPWLDRPHWHLSPGLLLALAITGILATALAFTIQTWAQRYTTATRTALIYALEPVFAWCFSWFLTGELLSRQATLGAVLILLGIVLVEVKRADDAKHPMVSIVTPEV